MGRVDNEEIKRKRGVKVWKAVHCKVAVCVCESDFGVMRFINDCKLIG